MPYRWGGTSPSGGFDCSGLVYWTYGRLGIALPHSSYALAGKGRPVRSSRLRPGDLLFFWGLGHVGLYVGHGRMVHAPHAGERVQVVRLAASGYGRALVAARRFALTAQRLGSSSTIPSRATTGGSSVFDSSDLASASSCSMMSSEWVGS